MFYSNKNRFATWPMIAVGIAMFVVANSGQTLSPDEKKIVDFIDRNNASAIALLETTVNIESPTEDIAGVKKVGSVYQKEFESLGMKTTWIDLPPEFKRAGHLMAESTGNCGKRLLLLGHLDTVLRGEPYRLDGTRAFGTGIGDMKGGNLIIIQALKALQAVGALKDTRIIVMFTGDEEDTADPIEASRRDMVAAAKRSDAALSFEGTVLNTATVGRRGFSSWRLEVTAKTGHSGQIFRDGMGHGAVFEAARILNEFRIALSKEKYLTFNPSLIVGGTTVETKDADGRAFGKTNVVAAKAVVNGDLRFISEAQKLSARTRMMEIVAKSLPGTTATITFEDGLPAMSPNDGNYGLLADLDKVSKDLGFGAIEALDPGERGAGDIAFVADLVPSLDGIGIGGSRASHAKGESAELSSLPMLTKRAALLIYRLTR
ncbi:MAG TPA: M20/M25/M40 family metallo-hydrolase [Pyrinomonadaceae bacterium]|nr:M20/M25/M40 family metallo-hydrolase [Pyrinomonadaceae bacterium]HQX56775.1 M20/M25/M40 family metallo-hydrolase [Pyrinomonadaceae bacterium]HQY68097.1 M20/M25/M40 family metallo-hydrolase [Pyrinomonadaceae bacterium]HRA41026.1 M20/M25/M40 family metallo-hydrolase [Pyrinomonadaceae bacterium]